MADDIFLFDTHALIEIINNNLNYEEYADKDVVINEFIFAELCYKMFLDNIENSHEYIEELKPSIIQPTEGIIEKAMKFRLLNKKKKVSMTDCISYIQAKELGIKFLTGDKEFEGLENVEFVK